MGGIFSSGQVMVDTVFGGFDALLLSLSSLHFSTVQTGEFTMSEAA